MVLNAWTCNWQCSRGVNVIAVWVHDAKPNEVNLRLFGTESLMLLGVFGEQINVYSRSINTCSAVGATSCMGPSIHRRRGDYKQWRTDDALSEWWFGSLLCKAIPYLQGVVVGASVNTLGVVAVERYVWRHWRRVTVELEILLNNIFQMWLSVFWYTMQTTT